MAAEASRNSPAYSYLGLPTYMAATAERSAVAPVSRVLDMDREVRPTHISHLALATNNFDEVANWWQTVLQAKPSLSAEGMLFMAFDSEHHKVVVFDMKGLARRQGAAHEFCGMHHIAFSYASFEDLASTYLRLKASGILPWRAINHGTSFALDYHDPAGTPPEAIAILQQKFAAAVKTPVINKRLVEFGVEPVGSNSADFAELLQRENARWSKLVGELKIVLD